MKTITTRIIGIMQVIFLGFLGCGVCWAGELSDLDEAIPISPFGVIDTTVPTFEWTSVPGATSYCLLIEDIDAVPVYLAWYTDEEAGCTATESEVCAVTPSHIVHGEAWAVLPCMEGGCGQWSTPTPFGVDDRAAARPDTNICRDPDIPKPKRMPIPAQIMGDICRVAITYCKSVYDACLNHCIEKYAGGGSCEVRRRQTCGVYCRANYLNCFECCKQKQQITQEQCQPPNQKYHKYYIEWVHHGHVGWCEQNDGGL